MTNHNLPFTLSVSILAILILTLTSASNPTCVPNDICKSLYVSTDTLISVKTINYHKTDSKIIKETLETPSNIKNHLNQLYESHENTITIGKKHQQDPLILIDDLESDKNVLDQLDSRSIESVEVYTNAGTVVKFGSKATNGALVITTNQKTL